MWFFLLRIALGPAVPAVEVRVYFPSQAACEAARATVQVAHDREGWQSLACREGEPKG